MDRATLLANQMLSLAKVEQLRQQAGAGAIDLAEIVRAVALDLSPLVAENDLDFSLETHTAPVYAHDWMLRELARNLLHNAIKHCPPGTALAVRIAVDTHHAVLTVSDSGPGISSELRERLFQPFSAGDVRNGSGLGLAICHEIVAALEGSISLDNRTVHSHVQGLDAVVRLKLARTSHHG